MNQDPDPTWGPPGHSPASRSGPDHHDPQHQPYSVRARSHYGSLYDSHGTRGGRSMVRRARGGVVVVVVLVAVGIIMFVMAILGVLLFAMAPM